MRGGVRRVVRGGVGGDCVAVGGRNDAQAILVFGGQCGGGPDGALVDPGDGAGLQGDFGPFFRGQQDGERDVCGDQDDCAAGNAEEQAEGAVQAAEGGDAYKAADEVGEEGEGDQEDDEDEDIGGRVGDVRVADGLARHGDEFRAEAVCAVAGQHPASQAEHFADQAAGEAEEGGDGEDDEHAQIDKVHEGTYRGGGGCRQGDAADIGAWVCYACTARRHALESMVNITLPVDEAVAAALATPAQLLAAGRYLSEIVRGQNPRFKLIEAMVLLGQEAQANGITDEIVDAELKAWRAERAADADGEAA